MPPIDAAELTTRLQHGENLNLLDVREEIEYHTYNIGGKNVPLSKLNAHIATLSDNKNDELIVICKAGLRSETARLLLKENGYGQVRNLTGGLLALQKLKK